MWPRSDGPGLGRAPAGPAGALRAVAGAWPRPPVPRTPGAKAGADACDNAGDNARADAGADPDAGAPVLMPMAMPMLIAEV